MDQVEIPEQSRNLMQLIDDHFIKDKDVYEVVQYVLACLTIDEAVTSARLSGGNEVRGIPPQSYYLMKKYDNGLTTNKFWIENYAPIKMQIALTDIKHETNMKYINLQSVDGVDNDTLKRALKSSRSILMTRLDVLTLIAFLWKGPAYAEDFDAKFRLAFQLVDKHEQFYSESGI